MSKLSKAIAGVAIASLALATVGFAAQAAGSEHATGTIASIEAKAGWIDVQIGTKLERFHLDTATAILDQGQQLTTGDLKAGEKVEVTWTHHDGKNIASRLLVTEHAPAKSSTRH
ncbi:MAG: hypothetical protein H6511_05485 [Holophagales bacterium]|nr:hypothetical protein [Holophagales bacterium]